jgi:hypothetical protein
MTGTAASRWGVGCVVLAACTVAASLTGACKQVTETVVEKGVKAAKDTTKGIEEGIEEGRKSGSSVDDAVVIAGAKELEGKGAISIRGIREQSGNPEASEVEIVVENSTDSPLRITKLEVVALDKEDFVVRPTTPPSELTVLAKAKDRFVVPVPLAPAKISKVRIWGVDHAAP